MDFLQNIPVINPPPGTTSNFVNPKTVAPGLIAINAVFVPLMLISVAIRVYVKGSILRAIGWDDCTCVLAATGTVVHSVMMMIVVHLGYGRHMWDIRAISLTPEVLRQLVSLAIIYPIVIVLVKLSIFLLYLRLFGLDKTFRYYVYYGLGIQLICYTALLGPQIATAVKCVSITALTVPLCQNSAPLIILQGVINVVSDFYMLALPVPQVLRLQLPLRRKIGLLAIFLAGLIACIVSLARLIYAAVRYHDQDVLYNAALTSHLTVVELNLAIIAACMSALPMFFSKSKIFHASTYDSVRSRFFGSRSRGSRNRGVKNSSGGTSQGDSAGTGRKDASGKYDRYIELREPQNVHVSAPRQGEGGWDRYPNGGILRTVEVDYNVARMV